MFEKSIIVAAHPDDEILWFSSILSRVDDIVLCFLSVPSRPDWTAGRHQIIENHPLENVSCLRLQEAEVFHGVDWSHPVEADFGLQITEPGRSDTVYKQNFESMTKRLRPLLQGRRNVFTHNPWGEYGHVEHVQVYRAVKVIQQEEKFDLWFSTYCSNKSVLLMLDTLGDRVVRYETLRTDKELAGRIARIYKNHNCWTWYDDYEWCDEDTFIRDDDTGQLRHGTIYPINLINVGVPALRNSKAGSTILGEFRTALRKARNWIYHSNDH